MDLPRYYLIGSWRRPVKVVPTADGGMTILAYDWARGEFERGLIYANTIFASSDDVERVSSDIFEQEVAKNRLKLEPEAAGLRDARQRAVESSEFFAEMNARMKERLEEYDWQADRILNYSTGSVLFDTIAKVYDTLEMMTKDKERYEIIRFLDRFAHPLDDGYRDILMNLVMPNGHITEMRLEIESVHHFSTEKAVSVYDQIREVNARVIAEQRDYSADETKKVIVLQTMLRPYYEKLLLAAKSKA